MTIGEKIKLRLKEMGMSQNELARRAGLTSSGISTIINGTFEPRMDNLRRIAQVFGCLPGDLLDDTDAQKEKEAEPDLLRKSILDDYDRMTPAQRAKAREYMDLLLNQKP